MKIVSKLCRTLSVVLIIILLLAAVVLIVPLFSEAGGKALLYIPLLGALGSFIRTPLGIVSICAMLIALVLLRFMPSALESDKEQMNWDYN